MGIVTRMIEEINNSRMISTFFFLHETLEDRIIVKESENLDWKIREMFRS